MRTIIICRPRRNVAVPASFGLTITVTAISPPALNMNGTSGQVLAARIPMIVRKDEYCKWLVRLDSRRTRAAA